MVALYYICVAVVLYHGCYIMVVISWLCYFLSFFQRTANTRSVSVNRPNSPYISPSAIGLVASIRHSQSENSAWSAWAWYTHILNPSYIYIYIYIYIKYIYTHIPTTPARPSRTHAATAPIYIYIYVYIYIYIYIYALYLYHNYLYSINLNSY